MLLRPSPIRVSGSSPRSTPSRSVHEPSPRKTACRLAGDASLAPFRSGAGGRNPLCGEKERERREVAARGGGAAGESEREAGSTAPAYQIWDGWKVGDGGVGDGGGAGRSAMAVRWGGSAMAAGRSRRWGRAPDLATTPRRSTMEMTRRQPVTSTGGESATQSSPSSSAGRSQSAVPSSPPSSAGVTPATAGSAPAYAAAAKRERGLEPATGERERVRGVEPAEASRRRSSSLPPRWMPHAVDGRE
ncbi:hypothetical protein DAI22_07g024701 [Oryza sativa Japonica Group]|nr:hypothetical protein DAI22_07g024701 [Oryza sativa Japonica Group]